MVFNDMTLYYGSSPGPTPPTPPTPTYTTAVEVYYPSTVDEIGITNIDSGSGYVYVDSNPSGHTTFELPRGGEFRVRWFRGSDSDYRDVTVTYGQTVTVDMRSSPSPTPTGNAVLNFYAFSDVRGKTIYVEQLISGAWYNSTSISVPANPSGSYVSCTVSSGTYRASFSTGGSSSLFDRMYYMDDSSNTSWAVSASNSPYTLSHLSSHF